MNHRHALAFTSAALLLALALAPCAPGSAIAAGPEGQVTWAVHITLAPTWFDPAETSGIITPYSSTGVRTAPSTLSPTAPASIVTNPHQNQSLPLTGINVEAIAFVGLLLVAGGLTLRWRVARR